MKINSALIACFLHLLGFFWPLCCPDARGSQAFIEVRLAEGLHLLLFTTAVWEDLAFQGSCYSKMRYHPNLSWCRNGNLGINIIQWDFSSLRLFFTRKVPVSWRGGSICEFSWHHFSQSSRLCTLLLQPLEGLLWPHSCRTGLWLSPFMRGAKEIKMQLGAWCCLINASEAERHILSVQWLFRVWIPELVRSDIDGPVLFLSSYNVAP